MNQEKPKVTEVSVAPMMDWTDRHCRYFHRLIAPHVKLYTEMVTTGALIHGDAQRFLQFHESEHPVVLQLGGSDPKDLAHCSKLGAKYGYNEINLNCGCPSGRVQSGLFGACLMKEQRILGQCIEAMKDAVDIPVSIKCRVGVDEFDSFEFLNEFVESLVDKGCKTFIFHARKAWLSGLSPKENREIPELNYERVYKIKERYPALQVILNGGINSIDLVRDNLARLDGVMIGREAYQNPYILSEVERTIFRTENLRSRENVALAMIPYINEQLERAGTPVKSITRHMIGLFQGLPGAKRWRQALSTLPYEDNAKGGIIERALDISQSRTREAA